MESVGDTALTVQIGNRLIGDGQPCFIIAEAGVNHNGSLDQAKKLVDAAVDAGADAVKFQMRDFDTLYSGEALNNFTGEDLGVQYVLHLIRDFELSEAEFSALADYCDLREIMFLCTPFDLHSVDALERLRVPAYKIGSPDMTNFELLEYVAARGKPMIVSTGMSTINEIDNTVLFLKQLGAEFVLLHCNSTYPSSFRDLNLRFIQSMKSRYGNLVGYSGHELGIAISEAAAVLGACIIERHITLDRTMKGPDHALSLEPIGIRNLVRNIRNIELALGSETRWLNRGEYMNRLALGKGLVTAKTISRGEVIERHMVVARSPGRGLTPQKLYELVGTVARRDFVAGEYFTDDDLQEKRKASREFSSPNKWGLIVRYHDISTIIGNSNPPAIEFHFSSHDIEEEQDIPYFPDQELIVHTPELWGDHLLDLCSTSPSVRAESIINVNKALDVTRRLRRKFGGTPERVKVVLHMGGMSYGGPIADNTVLYDNLAQSLTSLNQEGIELLLENLPPAPWYKGGQWFSNAAVNAEEFARFCREHGYNICYDVSHAQLACNFLGQDHVAYLTTLLPFIKHMHVSDGAGTEGEGLQIGEGEVEMVKLAPLLIGTGASFVPEIWLGHHNNGEAFWEALDRLKHFGF